MSAKIPLLERKFLSKIALVGFLLTLPLSIRKVFFVFSPDGSGAFNEYTDISLYLSDIMVLALFTIIILENKNSILSILWWKKLFHVEQLLLPLVAPLPFLCWSALSIFWSRSEMLAFYATFRLFEGYLIYFVFICFIVPRGTMKQFFENCFTWNNFYLKNYNTKMFHVEQLEGNIDNTELFSKIVPRGTMKSMAQYLTVKCSTWNNVDIIFISIILSGLIQSVIAFLQFILQSWLGLAFLGESILSPFQSGVAKIVLGNDVFIRSYGLFPHPNILGGFLGVSILLTISYPLVMSRKMFHVEHFVFLYRLALFIQVLGFLLTFSKSAYLGLFIAVSYYFIKMFHVEHGLFHLNNSDNVPRGTFLYFKKWLKQNCSTWNNSNIQTHNTKMFHVEHWKRLLFIIFFITGLVFFLTRLNWYYFIIQPIVERYFFFQEFFSIVHQHFFTGVGISQSVFIMQDFFPEKLNIWQFQPIHSLYLLIFSEVGSIGLVFFLFFVLSLCIVPRGTIGTIARYLIVKCSTWNNFCYEIMTRNKLFHVEQFSKSMENVPRGTIRAGVVHDVGISIVIFMVTISLFDHYLFDIQQGQLLSWLVLALCFVFIQKEFN